MASLNKNSRGTDNEFPKSKTRTFKNLYIFNLLKLIKNIFGNNRKKKKF